jgi:hypothetical protein
MDPVQLQLMQQIAMGQVPGIPGTQAPLTIGGFGGSNASGASLFMATTAPGMSPYTRAITGNPMPDISPLAPLQPVLSRFGIVGAVAGLAGNAALTNMMEGAGVMPAGDAGSYLQAYRTREFQRMQREVATQVADADAEGIYRTFRGGAALVGMPFNHKQREAARNLANTIAEYGPTMAMAAPELLDTLAGERGSIQAMAGQLMEANRYRVDPLTGQMGYGTESNAELVNQTFNRLFEGDNVARMQGLRAGDMGQLYRMLAPEGAVGPRENLRDRTLMQLIRARDANQLEAIGAEAEVDVSGNLSELSNEDLLKLRSTSSMRSRMTDADARQISDQLKDYVSTLAAIREVFGENGNPNAPIPQLINALETLTSGQMHRFDSVRLNTLIRDMQSLVQLSGKSIDQYMAMRRHAADEGQQLGIGTTFATTATNIGITTGMAFAERGGATGFGALSREEAEQASMNLFNRGMASEMSNALGALGRIEAVSGFATGDDAAGRAGGKLRAIMEAARAGENTYIDPATGEEMYLPTREAHFRSLITAGGVIGMNGADFNMMLGDRTSNLRMLHSDPRLQQAAFNNQAREINTRVDRQIGNRLSSAEPLMTAGLNASSRNAAARSMGSAALAALNDLSPAEAENKTTRNRAITDALLTEAGNQGIELSEQEARVMAVSVYGQAENGVRRFGFDNWTAFAQVMGEDVTEARKTQTAQYRARAGVNEAMSGLGPQGTVMQRFFTALQRQGDKGGEANLNTMLQDMFGTDIDKAREKLMPELQAVADEKLAIDNLRGELEGASAADRRELERKIETRTSELKARVAETQTIGRELGIGGGTEIFDLEDVNTARKAARNLSNFNRIDQVRLLAATGNVTEADVMRLGQERLTSQDFKALGAEDRRLALVAAAKAAEGDIEALPEEVQKRYNDVLETAGEVAARKSIRQKLLADVSTTEEFAEKRSENYKGLVIADIDNEAERATIVRQRRMSRILVPTKEEITTRLEELNESLDRPAISSLPTKAERDVLKKEIKQLEARLEGPTPEQQEAIKQQIESRKSEMELAVTSRQQTLTQEIEQLEAELKGPTPEQQESIKQQIESRELSLVAADPVQRQTLSQEIEQLKAELEGPTPERQEVIKQQIESLELSLSSESVPAQQEVLSQEIEQLKAELAGPTLERQEAIKQQIESRELALVAADPAQRQTLTQEIKQFKAELDRPTSEQQEAIRQQIESRERALSRESVPAQQEVLAQEIKQLKAKLEGSTPERQKSIKQQIESRELALAAADPVRQQMLTQEIEQLEAELAGPTLERREAIKQQIESRELALVAADPAQRQTLSQEIEQLKGRLEGPTPEQQESIKQQIESRERALSRESVPAQQEVLSQEIKQLKAKLTAPTPEQQEDIRQQIESRELALVAADPVRQQLLQREIQQFKAELEGPTPEQQEDIRQQIESRELALSRESVPAQQEVLAQEIKQLKVQLEGPTPEQQEAIKQQIESRELSLVATDPVRQQMLTQEIEQLKAELEGPTPERQEAIRQQIESRELALVTADPVRQQTLTQEIEQLEAELKGPTPEQQESIKQQIEARKEKALELQPLTSEQQKNIENTVAQEFGFESYAAYSQSVAEEITSEQRVELQKQLAAKQAQLAKPDREVREAEDYARTLMVEELLLAEKQLQAVGLLTEEQTLNDDKDGTFDVEDFDVMESQAPELQARLSKSKVEDRAGIVSKYFDQQVRRQFYSTAVEPEEQAAEIEQNRVAAREALSKPEGRRALAETRTNLATLADMRREFLMDEGAAVRLGSAVTLDAITRSREADLNLQDLSNDYYGGSSELMLTTSGVGMTVEGAKRAEKEFQELTAEPRTEANAKKLGDIAARLSEEYETDISTTDLNLSHYKDYIALRGTDYVTEMTKANETLAAGVTSKARAESMGVTEDQLESLQELTKLEATDFSKAAKSLGITEEKYRAVVSGKEELPSGLRLFKGKDAAEQLRAARADDHKLVEIDTSIEKLKRDIDTSAKHSPDGKASPSLLKSLEKMQASRTIIADRQAKVMQTAGLDSSKQADRQKFQQLLTAQGEVQLLETRTENYATARRELADSGLSVEDIDVRLGEMKAAEIKAQADLKAFRDLDLGDAGEAIARGFAIDAQSDPEKAKELRSAIESGGTSEAHERNLKLVSGVLSRVKDFEIGGEGATSIKKLDELTDQYLAAKKSGGNALQELANTHGMQVSELDSMMNHTEFLGMALGEEEDEYSPERLGKAFRAAMNTDVAAEVAAEEERQLEITGTVVVTGVVTGEGTFEDSVGRTVR